METETFQPDPGTYKSKVAYMGAKGDDSISPCQRRVQMLASLYFNGVPRVPGLTKLDEAVREVSYEMVLDAFGQPFLCGHGVCRAESSPEILDDLTTWYDKKNKDLK